ALMMSNSSTDAFVAKYAPTGILVWAREAGGSSADDTYAVTVDGQGNVYVGGSFRNTVDFDPGPGIANLTSDGSDDGFLWKLDTNGNYIWARRAGGGGGSDIVDSVAVDMVGNVYIGGYFQALITFGTGPISLQPSVNS